MSDHHIRGLYSRGDSTKSGKVTTTERGSDKIDLNVTDERVLAALGGGNTVPTIFNISCPVPGTEYSQTLPTDCSGFIIQARGNSKITYSYVSGASTTWTIPIGNSFEDKNTYSSQTIYFTCTKADVVEIVAYT